MKSSFILASAVILAASSSVITIAQQRSERHSPNQTMEYRDKATGKLHILMPAEPDATLSPTTGTFSITLDISVLSKWPAGTKPTYDCTLDAGVTSTNLSNESYTEFSDSVWSVATVTGSTGTCTFTLPYAWLVPPASTTVTNTFLLVYSVSAQTGSSNAASGVLRMQSGPVLSGTIPATGTVTKKTINVVL